MNFKIGDTVVVIDDVIKGKVIVVDKNKIVIETIDGFPFEFAPSELVIVDKDQAELSKFSDISNEDLFDKINEKPKRKQSKFKTVTKTDKLPPMEVDLHIHHLTSSTKGLDNYDMLNLQIETAKQKLEYAIRNRIPRVVFVHGVGEGVLKTELEYLFKKYHVDWYAASFKKYGLGATEVYIYQNPKN
ncbi:DNA mismatch repair protein MutS [Lutibacter sp. B1]|uniref:DNA mismatch repair protein MutS n=1 Tax=Lutibacter sp. B1 TaxID=2725996 RepID=UPI00145736FC|nr:DNA mismatch repair protein MutS [Lutibacter sp. B1]NLP56966.1 DNA mismatch repair protein MutS [Lutibacter sp. B1]